MATQIEAFRVLIPEMATTDDSTVTLMLSMAASTINLDLIPDEVQGIALVYKAASLLSDRQRRLESGAASSNSAVLVREKEGDLEKQYSESTASVNGTAFRNAYEERFAEIVPQNGYIMTRLGRF